MAQETPLSEPDWLNVNRVLVIMAHPDDPDFTCAGTAIQMARQGIEVTYMILTNGDKGNHDPDVTRNQLIAIRKIEQRAAAELSGVKQVLFMGVEDGFLRSTRAIRKRVTREIRRIRPEIIICMHPDRYLVGNSYINHPDHRNAGLVALDSIFPAADNPMFYPDMADEGYLPHKISQLYVVGDAEPNLRIDITNEIDLKIEAIRCHKSQFTLTDEDVAQWKEEWAEKQEDGSLRFFEDYRVMKLA